MTFSFGHVVGLGIQELLIHSNIDQAYWNCFNMWSADLLDSNPKQNKSVWLAFSAIEKFAHLQAMGFLKDWELASYNGKPAVELSFIIKFPDGFTYKGYVDAVLVHAITKEVMVLECKTTSGTFVSPAMYKNSAQAVGYSIVLDALFPELSSYEVMYLLYKTKGAEYETMPFQKDYLSRALWIRELLLDIETIKMYENAGVYPMHGESCYAFYRECEYFGICTLSTEALITPITDDIIEGICESVENDFQITLSLNDLIESQLSKE